MDDPTDFRRLSRPFDAFYDDEIARVSEYRLEKFARIHVEENYAALDERTSSGNGRSMIRRARPTGARVLSYNFAGKYNISQENFYIVHRVTNVLLTLIIMISKWVITKIVNYY